MTIRTIDNILWSLPLALYLLGRLIWRRDPPLPPGPPGWPLIGNLFDFPGHAPHKMWGAMSRQHGHVMSLDLMGMPYVILNSYKVANDLLEKKSSATANRPQFTMCNDLVGWGSTMVFMQYGDTYQKHRKFFRQQIDTKGSLETFYPAEEAGVRHFICEALKNPDDLIAHSRRMAGSLFLRISHGYTVKGDRDLFVDMAHEVVANLCIAVTPGLFLVDTLPILRYLPEWFPGGGFHRDAKRWRKNLHETAETLYGFVLERMREGDAVPSFISRQLQEGVTADEEEILKWAAFIMFIAGTNATSSAVSAFFLAMTRHPEVLSKARAEMDAVVGQERLPTFEDRDALPYVNAICTEVLRWHPLLALTSHVTTQDIAYEGKFIPKGTCIVGNIWFILSDPETYPNPDVFDPERFLGENLQPDPRKACFGWGKRFCPGARLAESILFISVAMAVATLDILRPIENGIEVVPTYDVEEAPLARLIKPFKCRITPRSRKAEDLLRA